MKLQDWLIPAALAAIATGCSRRPAPGADTANLPPAEVRLVTVRTEETAGAADMAGTVQAVRRALLAPKVMGAIAEVPVALGSRVRVGAVLVRISAPEIAARAAQARARLDQAERDFRREQSLFTQGASTAETVHDLGDRAAEARAAYREAEIMAGYATIRAPFDGFVARKFVQAGDLASPGQPLLEIDGAGRLEVETGIPDALAGRVAVGGRLEVRVPAAGARFEGVVTELSSAADPGSGTVTAKIAAPGLPSLRPGQFAEVRVPAPASPALFAPAEAVSVSGEMERVFVAGPGGRAELRLVRTGARRGADVEILSGLDSGERVVVRPPAGLREGQLLETRP